MSSGFLVLESFVEMITERGLSYRKYDDTRSDYTIHHMIDIIKDGKKLATYDIANLHWFSEDDMAKELDKRIAIQAGGIS